MTKNIPLIRCPYCFFEFSHDRVCFKAKTVLTSQDLESMGSGEDLNAAVDGEKAAGNRIVQKLFIEKEDAEYKNFWNEYPGSEPDWKYKKYPVITPESTKMMKDGNGYRKDAGGFVASVVDCFDRESTVRICPRCHNELPTSYGKYQVYTIAVVGITKSGKTVYLSYMMQNFSRFMANAGLAARKMGETTDSFIRQNRVAKGQPLPQGTLPEHLSQPLFYRVADDRQSCTLVFYDIAGETCVKPDMMEKYGKFIRNADGIIFMLDPEQFIQLRENPDREVLEPEAVLNAMSEAFFDADNENGHCSKPLAVVLSKSDILKKRLKMISSESNIFRHIGYNKRGFQIADYRNLNGELRQLFSKLSLDGAIMETLKKGFSCYGFFAVSILDEGLDRVEVMTPQGEKKFKYTPMNTPSGVRAEEPLLWILYQLGMIPAVGDGMDNRNRGWFHKMIEYVKAIIKKS